MRLSVDNLAETILTYSWVLLIFGLFLTLLGAFGYFEQIARAPDACEVAGPFACLSVEASNASELSVVVRSGLNASIELVGVQVLRMRPPCGGIADLTVNRQPLPAAIGPLDIARVSVRCSDAWFPDDRVEGDITMMIRNETGEFNASLFVRSYVP